MLYVATSLHICKLKTFNLKLFVITNFAVGNDDGQEHKNVELFSLPAVVRCLQISTNLAVAIEKVRVIFASLISSDLIESIADSLLDALESLMAALPNIGGALCSTPQILTDAH